MTTLTRTDVHAPSRIIPADYTFIAYDCIRMDGMGDAIFLQAERDRIKAHMAQTGGKYSTHAHGGVCMVCGNSQAQYTLTFYHQPSNTYVKTGSDCATKLDMSHGDFNAFVNAVRQAEFLAKGKKAAIAKWTEAGLGEALALVAEMREPRPELTKPKDANCPFGSDCGANWHTVQERDEHDRTCPVCNAYWAASREHEAKYTHAFKIGSMLRTTEQYGTLTEKMVSTIKWLMDKHVGHGAMLQNRAEEKAIAADCPAGRVTIEGTVVGLKSYESYFGWVEKMTVKHDTGFCVYVSVPSGATVSRGDKVKLVCTVTVKDTDTKFGFGSRPAKVKGMDSIVTEASQPVAV